LISNSCSVKAVTDCEISCKLSSRFSDETITSSIEGLFSAIEIEVIEKISEKLIKVLRFKVLIGCLSPAPQNDLYQSTFFS
jgi:hypothetical protein